MGTLPNGYLSSSAIILYKMCPKKYWFKYVEKIREDMRSPSLLGQSFHKALEIANKEKMETGEILPTGVVGNIYNRHWEKKKKDIDWQEDENPDELKKKGQDMTKTYYEAYGKKLLPVQAETSFLSDVDGIPFKGFMDVIETDTTIRDFKTSKRSPSADVVDSSLQLSSYAHAFRQLYGEKEKAVGLDYVVRLKKENKVVRLETEIDEERIDRFKETVHGVANAITNDVFYRNEGPMCKSCGYREWCLGSKDRENLET